MKSVADMADKWMQWAAEVARQVEERNARIVRLCCPTCPGPYTVDLSPAGRVGPPCPLYILEDPVCRYVRHKAWRQVWQRLGVPERYWDVSWDGVPEGIAARVRERLLPRIRYRGAVVLGETGTGKTSLLALILRAAYEEYGILGRMVSASDLVDWHVDSLADIPLLGIDDLGVAPWPSAAARARFDRLVDVRYGRKLAMLITSNMGLRDLADFCGYRAWDRIRETCYVIHLPGASRRWPARDNGGADG